LTYLHQVTGKDEDAILVDRLSGYYFDWLPMMMMMTLNSCVTDSFFLNGWIWFCFIAFLNGVVQESMLFRMDHAGCICACVGRKGIDLVRNSFSSQKRKHTCDSWTCLLVHNNFPIPRK